MGQKCVYSPETIFSAIFLLYCKHACHINPLNVQSRSFQWRATIFRWMSPNALNVIKQIPVNKGSELKMKKMFHWLFENMLNFCKLNYLY